MIAFGVCVGNPDRFQSVARPSICAVAEPDTMLLASSENESIFSAYNEILEHVAPREDLEALVLMHEDVRLDDEQLLRKLRSLFSDESVGVVGAIGALGVTGLAWWDGIGRGRCAETRGVIDFGGGSWDVDAVDGLFLALSPWAVRSVRFDDRTYQGFHGYDVDYCFAVRAEGRRVITADLDLFHHTKGGFGDEAQWRQCDERFRAKWGLTPTARSAPEVACIR